MPHSSLRTAYGTSELKANCFIGIDNGTSGTIGVIGPVVTHFFKTPARKYQDYHKTRVKHLNRLVYEEFKNILKPALKYDYRLHLEKPYSNAKGYIASTVALRCWESQLVAIEQLGISKYYVCTSKDWQDVMLPGVKGVKELKKASLDKGVELYPEHKELIRRHKDADGLLIAHWAKLTNNQATERTTWTKST